MLKDYTIEDLIRIAGDQELDFSPEDVMPTYESMQKWDAKQWDLFKRSGEDLDTVEDINLLDDIDTDEIDFNGETLLVLTDDEAENRWDEELEYYFDEVVLPEIPDCYQGYIDYEKWVHDARMDGRGHAISRYDGYEDQYKIKFDDGSEEWISIFRM